jgi:hypothetical protein
MDKALIPCFVCGKELEDIGVNEPIKATQFKTYGHYGSGVFDPMDGTRLAINICDTCLIEGSRKQMALHLKPLKDPEIFKCQ